MATEYGYLYDPGHISDLIGQDPLVQRRYVEQENNQKMNSTGHPPDLHAI